MDSTTSRVPANIFIQFEAATRRLANQKRFIAALTAALISLGLFVHGAEATSGAPVIQVAGSPVSPKVITMIEPAGEDYFYTLDGSTPTTGSTPYNSPFTISDSVTLKAIAHDSGGYSTVTTQEIYAPIILLDADSGVNVGVGSPQPVSSWNDLSNNNNNGSTAGSVPPLLNTNSQLDLPAIGLNGTSQFFSLPTGFSTFNGASLFVITRPNVLNTGGRILDLGQGASGNNILMRIASSGDKPELGVFNGTGTSTFLQSKNTISAGRFYLLEAVVQPGTGSTTAAFYVNGEANSGSMTGIQNVSRTSNFIGQASAAGSLYSGSIAQLVLFSKSLPAAERKAVEALLLQRFQLLSVVPEAPKISVPGGTLNGPTQVVISMVPDTVVRITTDGSTPSSTSSPVYDGCPIAINYTQTLKALAVKNGVPSTVASETYTLNSDHWPEPSSSDMTAPTINLTLPVQSQ